MKRANHTNMLKGSIWNMAVVVTSIILPLISFSISWEAEANGGQSKVGVEESIGGQRPAAAITAAQDPAPTGIEVIKPVSSDRTDVFLPMVGSPSGGGRAAGRSGVWIYNSGPGPAKIQFFFLRLNQANPTPAVYNDTLSSGEGRLYSDASENMFGESSSSVLHVISDRNLIVSFRASDPGLRTSDAGSMSQFFAAVPASFAIGAGEKTTLLGSSYRLQSVPQASGSSAGPVENAQVTDRLKSVATLLVGLVETTGGTALVRVTTSDETGAMLATADYALAGFEPRFLGVADLVSGAAAGNVRVEVEVVSGEGKVIVFGSALGQELAGSKKTSRGLHDQVTPDWEVEAAQPVGKLTSIEASSPAEKVAQGGSVTGGGTIGRIPMWTDSRGLGNSMIYQGSSGNLFMGPRQSDVNVRLWVSAEGASGAIVGSQEGGGQGSAVTGFGQSGTGVYGNSTAGGTGVQGESVSGPGVKGQSESGRGVEGKSKTLSGVYGESETLHGVGGLSKGGGFGVLGRAEGSALAGVHGRGTASADGVQGEAEGQGRGVYGKATSGDGYMVKALAAVACTAKVAAAAMGYLVKAAAAGPCMARAQAAGMEYSAKA